MRFLIDLTHPAHVHFFRNLISRLRAEGHEVKLTGRSKDILVELAASYGLELEVFGEARPGAAALARELLHRQRRLYRIVRQLRPHAAMAIAGTFIAGVGRLTRTPTYVFYDTEHATLSNLLAYPFATCTYVPRCYFKPIRWRHQRYDGYHELAYLHPRYFEPDPGVLEEAGVRHDEIFSIVRFVSWGAAHDLGRRGLSDADKRRAIDRLSVHGRVLLSAEGDLPADLEPLRLRLDPGRLHDLMARAALVFGESGTMPSEAAVLGVPSVYLNPLRLGYLEELERDYGLVSTFRPEHLEEALDRSDSILDGFDREGWCKLAARMREDKIDVTRMLHRIALERPHA